VLNAGNHISVL